MSSPPTWEVATTFPSPRVARRGVVKPSDLGGGNNFYIVNTSASAPLSSPPTWEVATTILNTPPMLLDKGCQALRLGRWQQLCCEKNLLHEHVVKPSDLGGGNNFSLISFGVAVDIVVKPSDLGGGNNI